MDEIKMEETVVVTIVETWHLKPGLENKAREVMQAMDDMLGPGAHEHAGWCGHAHFFQSASRPTEIMMIYPWRSRALHDDLRQREEPLLRHFIEEYCVKPRDVAYYSELTVDVESPKNTYIEKERSRI